MYSEMQKAVKTQLATAEKCTYGHHSTNYVHTCLLLSVHFINDYFSEQVSLNTWDSTGPWWSLASVVCFQTGKSRGFME